MKEVGVHDLQIEVKYTLFPDRPGSQLFQIEIIPCDSQVSWEKLVPPEPLNYEYFIAVDGLTKL